MEDTVTVSGEDVPVNVIPEKEMSREDKLGVLKLGLWLVSVYFGYKFITFMFWRLGF